MKQILSLILVVLLFYACGENTSNENTEKNPENNEIQKDNKVETETPPIDFANLFEDVDEFPLVIDSVFYSKIDKNNHKLNSEQVIELSKKIKEFELSYAPGWVVKEFLKLDSVKKANGMEEYMKNADLGMTVFSEAYPLATMKFNDKSIAYLWMISHSTVEACPYGEGDEIFISLYKDMNAICTYKIAEESHGSDAPYWGDTKIYPTINNDGLFTFRKINIDGGENEETGEEEITKTDVKFTFKLTNGDLTKIE